jgi:hypothetical protein
LQAIGTPLARVVFSSNTGTVPGAWYGFDFGATAGAPQSRMAWVTVEHAGSTGNAKGGVTIQGESPIFENFVIEKNQYAGVMITGGTPIFRGSDGSMIASNIGPGIRVTGGSSMSLSGVLITENSEHGIQALGSDGWNASWTLSATALTKNGDYAMSASRSAFASRIRASSWPAGTSLAPRRRITFNRGGGFAGITTNTSWPAAGIPYYVSGRVEVKGLDVVLTIDAANTVWFAPDSELVCNDAQRNAIRALGGPRAPIRFALESLPPGTWRGIWIGPKADAPQSRFEYVAIDNAGASERGAVTVHTGSPLFDHVTILRSTSSGST